MSIATSHTAHLVGLSAQIITVEVDISNGLNSVSVVGMGDRSVEEAKDRIAAAIKNSGYVSPKQRNQKVVISLAPAETRKEGPSFDLAMAIAYLSSSGERLNGLDSTLFLGELSLEGKVRPVAGVLPILCQAVKAGWKRAVIPAGNAEEASMAPGADAFAIESLAETVAFLSGKTDLEPVRRNGIGSGAARPHARFDMSSIRGNGSAKRGLEIAAAGGHNVLMFGPPGTGKTMLAESLPSILPPLSEEEIVEVTSIYSAARGLGSGIVAEPPFRAPHHTASYAAIVGGGAIPRPGEITLAHRGVLFMDEFPEFGHEVLEALRQPLEDREITVARAKGTVTFPAKCMLVAAMNPCPCGKTRGKGCICPANAIAAYRRRVSGPVLDRMDMWLHVHEVDYDRLSDERSNSERSDSIRTRVVAARDISKARFSARSIAKSCNAEMSANDIEALCPMTRDARLGFKATAKKLGLSGRAFHKVIKIGRTIADLESREVISESDILEALQYRQRLDEAIPVVTARPGDGDEDGDRDR